MTINYKVVQGGYRVSDQVDAVISTLLGSCIATCLFDSFTGVGGLNHFLLPGCGHANEDDLKYGVHSMELLLTSVLRTGAKREHLRAKLFGGARMSNNFSEIGAENVTFAEQFLAAEQIPCINKSVGGDYARKLRFFPNSGRAQIKMIDRSMMDDPFATTSMAL